MATNVKNRVVVIRVQILERLRVPEERLDLGISEEFLVVFVRLGGHGC